jgi:hypothetical protein
MYEAAKNGTHKEESPKDLKIQQIRSPTAEGQYKATRTSDFSSILT